jgi:hypothetical protein
MGTSQEGKQFPECDGLKPGLKHLDGNPLPEGLPTSNGTRDRTGSNSRLIRRLRKSTPSTESTPERERLERVQDPSREEIPEWGPPPKYRQKSRDKFSETGTEDLK